MYFSSLPGFFSGDKQNNIVVTPLFGLNYWIGLGTCLIFISTLFIFTRFYAKLSKYRSFSVTIGLFQLINYVLFYIFHYLNGDVKEGDWYFYLPFQLCSILDLTSALLLIFPCQRLFNITFPWIGPVILAFLFPDQQKHHFGLNHYFYYHYYFNHLIIVFGYFYLYLYGHVKAKLINLKQSINTISILAFMIFLFNNKYGTNFMFTGSEGYKFAISNVVDINTAAWDKFLRFSFMFLVGISLILFFYIIINCFLPPFYFNFGQTLNPVYTKKGLRLQKRKDKDKKIKKSKLLSP